MMDADPRERTRRAVEDAGRKNRRVLLSLLAGMCAVTVLAGALCGAGIGIFVGAMCAALCGILAVWPANDPAARWRQKSFT